MQKDVVGDIYSEVVQSGSQTIRLVIPDSILILLEDRPCEGLPSEMKKCEPFLLHSVFESSANNHYRLQFAFYYLKQLLQSRL